MASDQVIDRLEADHRNLRRLLELAEIEVEKLGESDAADLELLREIVDYVGGYPSLVHRPREEMVFELLRRRGTSAASVQQIAREHAALDRAAARAGKIVEDLAQEVALPRERVVADLRQLIAAYRGHMTIEEPLFAEARRRLAAADWASVDAVGVGRDPLFGSEPEARYGRLLERVARLRA